jgi:hypothetical protein
VQPVPPAAGTLDLGGQASRFSGTRRAGRAAGQGGASLRQAPAVANPVSVADPNSHEAALSAALGQLNRARAARTLRRGRLS